MPLYEYQCDACSNRFERIQKFSDPPVDVCPTCGGKVQKLLSSPAIQFKGTGWYITDYAKKSGSNSGKTGDVGKPASESSTASSESSSGSSGSTSSSSSTPSSGGGSSDKS